MTKRGGHRWLTPAAGAAAAVALLLAGCGASEGSASGSTPGRTSTTRAVDLTREELQESVSAGAAETDLEMTEDQVACFTDSLIDEVGLERLDALGIPAVDPFSDPVLAAMATNLDDAAAYFTPIFDCLETDSIIRSSVKATSEAAQDCVVDAVQADREVRVIYMLGTPEGADPDERMVKMTAPLVARALAIEEECAAEN